VREDAQVELGGFSGVVIEPEEWRNFIHGLHGTSEAVTFGKPTCECRCAIVMDKAGFQQDILAMRSS
jgi:hypothetical protein